eukprot:126248-Chlamydomonas_euryale.AAC.2
MVYTCDADAPGTNVNVAAPLLALTTTSPFSSVSNDTRPADSRDGSTYSVQLHTRQLLAPQPSKLVTLNWNAVASPPRSSRS